MKKSFIADTATLRADNNELQTQLTLAQAQINQQKDSLKRIVGDMNDRVEAARRIE